MKLRALGKLQPWIEVVLASCRDIWERDYAHLAPHKKMKKKRDAFVEWLYRRKEEDTATDEFRRTLSHPQLATVISVLTQVSLKFLQLTSEAYLSTPPNWCVV